MRIRIGRRRGLSLGAVALLLALLVLLRGPRFFEDIFRPAPAEGWYTAVRVVDGDTLVVSPNPNPASREGDRIRLIGVDTPESVAPNRPVEYFGKEAAEFTRRQCEGRRVRLVFDPAQTQDRYGRTLAYVYLEDGTFLNAEIIRQGYGFAYTRFPFAYLEEFRALEREARDARRGLWGGP